MAGVLQKPDALSLSGNLKPFVLSSSGKIVFNLLMGSDEETIFINNYEPGPDNTVRIDLREEMKALLAFNLDASQNSWVHTALVKDFKAVIDGQAYAFRVVGGGVADLADTPANWLSQHFLTWQPRHKRVTYYSPEWLTFYATEARTLKLKATFANGSTKQLNLLTATAGKAYTQNLQYAYVAGLLGNTYPTYYEVWTEGSGGSRSESQFYLYEEAKSADEQWFLFTNSLGGIDTIRAYGVNKLAAEHTHSLDEREEELEEYDVETERLYVKNTGWLDDYERHWLLDFFPATRKYIYEAGALRRIVLTDSEASYTSSDLPSSYTFTYRRCEKAALLNLVKNASEIPDVITIPDTASPNFTIPPRLAEFPRVTLGEGVLIPAIDPSDNTPSVTSFGQIHSVIYGDIVRAMAGQISGIVGELKVDILRTDSLAEPTDSNVFSALRTLQEIKKGQKDLDDRFLRKDIDDTAHGNISFDQTIYATGYKTGEDGTGWLIEQDGDAILKDVFSRGTFTVVGEALIGGNLHSRDYWSGWEDGKGWQVSKAGVAELQEASIRHNIIIGNRGGSPKFISGFPNGIGWDLAPYQRINAADVAETKWRLEIDDINVRGQMRVYEFVISQLRGENDNVIFAGMMRVDHADPENEIIYLDTEKGVLYNPFRAGDILMVQRFGGMPSAENGYNVIKQYELRVKEAHVGSLSDGENRVDWITVEKFVGNWEDVSERDVLTRVDSLTDSTRKGIVKVTTVDEIGAPYIDVVYGMKTNPETATKVRMGNLSGVRTVNNRDLTGVWGLYAEGAVLENSTYYMQNGQTVEQNFTVLNGKLESEISTVKNDMSLEAGNILKNSSFGSNMRYWESNDEVYFIYTADGYIFADEYYTEKKRVADIVSDKGRYVLRLRNSTITQRNAEMRLEGVDFEGNKETAEDGTETVIYPQFSFALYYRPLTDGTLKVGFNGKDLYTEEKLTASDAYKQLSKYAEWDGKGDFAISYTGEILIYGVSLFNDKLADAKIYLEGRITQTAEALTVDYKKLIKDGDDAVTEAYTALIKVTAENLTIDYKAALADQHSTITQAYEDLVSTTKQTIEQDYSSQISLTAQSLTATFNENIKTTKETLTQQITDTEDALSNEIETTKTTITEEYTSAISASAQSLTANFNKQVTTITETIDTTKTDLSNKIDTTKVEITEEYTAAISASASELTSKYDSVLFEKDAQGNYTSKLIYQSLFEQASDRIDLCVTKESYGTDKQTLEAAIKVNADAVSAQASRIDDLGNTISSAGWITTSDGNELWANKYMDDGKTLLSSAITQNANNISLKVSSSDFTGKNIVSKINLLKGTALIEAENIDLVGKVTFSMLSQDAINGVQPDLSGYASKGDIPDLSGYLKETTIIEGGYIKTGLINTDSIFANLVKVGQFSIQSGGQLSWEGKDYFGGKEFQMKLGSSKLPTNATIPTIIHTFSSSGRSHAGIAAVLQSSTNSVAIYGSTDGWGSNWPNAAFAGYFSGSIKTTGTCQAGTIAANSFRYAFNQNTNGSYEYYAGINVDPGDYDLDNIRFRIRGGIIVGVTDDSGNVLRGT